MHTTLALWGVTELLPKISEIRSKRDNYAIQLFYNILLFLLFAFDRDWDCPIWIINQGIFWVYKSEKKPES